MKTDTINPCNTRSGTLHDEPPVSAFILKQTGTASSSRSALAIILTSLLLWVGLSEPARAADSQIIIRQAPETDGDMRYQYYWDLLDHALAATAKDFGPYELKVCKYGMDENRRRHELEINSGLLNVIVHGSIRDYEESLLPIRIPLDKGLLGYRVFLIRADRQSDFNQIRTLADLRRFTVGQGAEWGDATILEAAGIPVVKGSSYEGLFGMLDAKRFDYFSRGVMEIGDEFELYHKQYPQLAIETNLMLYYPMARYFYVSRSPDGEKLARRIQTGLGRIIADGTFEKLFDEFKQPFIEHLRMKNRLLFRIENPLLTEETRSLKKECWFDPAIKSDSP